MNIQQIAAQTNVDAKFVEEMLYSMARAMREDGVAELFTESDSETRAQFVKAYGSAAARKVESMGTQYLTDHNTRSGVDAAVLASL